MNRTIGGVKFENIAGAWVYTCGRTSVHMWKTSRGWRIVKYRICGNGTYMSGSKYLTTITAHEAMTARECVLRMFGGNDNEK